MLLESGESAVIGGLTTDTDTRTDSRVPYLSAIPVIGELFKHQKHERQRRSLLVFITPQIMHGSADTEAVVQRELARRKTKLKDQINEMIDPAYKHSADAAPVSGSD
jgi:type II secretory pathway component GspD/PulD (secretin)